MSSGFESGNTEGWSIDTRFPAAVNLRSETAPDFPVHGGSRSITCDVFSIPARRVAEISRGLCNAGDSPDLLGRRISVFVHLAGDPLPAGSECSITLEGITRFGIGINRQTVANTWFQLAGTWPNEIPLENVRPTKIAVTCLIGGDWEGLLLIDDFQVE